MPPTKRSSSRDLSTEKKKTRLMKQRVHSKTEKGAVDNLKDCLPIETGASNLNKSKVLELACIYIDALQKKLPQKLEPKDVNIHSLTNELSLNTSAFICVALQAQEEQTNPAENKETDGASTSSTSSIQSSSSSSIRSISPPQ